MEKVAEKKTPADAKAMAGKEKIEKIPVRKTRKFINKKFEKKGGKGKTRGEKPRSEFDQKIISLRRVTRVMAGGRRFSFSAGMVIGDRKGSVGVGLGKASDTALAIDKAVRDAKKNLITPNLTENKSLPHEVEAKFSASRVLMMPNKGLGVKAGGAMRAVLELLGAKDITGKILSRSKNHVNNAKATVDALKEIGLKVRDNVKDYANTSDKKKKSK